MSAWEREDKRYVDAPRRYERSGEEEEEEDKEDEGDDTDDDDDECDDIEEVEAASESVDEPECCEMMGVSGRERMCEGGSVTLCVETGGRNERKLSSHVGC